MGHEDYQDQYIEKIYQPTDMSTSEDNKKPSFYHKCSILIKQIEVFIAYMQNIKFGLLDFTPLNVYHEYNRSG